MGCPPSPVSPTHDVVFNDANLSDTFISGVPAIWKAQKTGPHRSEPGFYTGPRWRVLG